MEQLLLAELTFGPRDGNLKKKFLFFLFLFSLTFEIFGFSSRFVLLNSGSAGFHMEVKTDNAGVSASNQFTIPTGTGTFNYSVDWGDGNVETGLTGSATHTYASAGTYTIKITGEFPHIYFNNGGDRQKLIDIKQWGNIEWGSFFRSFYGASNMTMSATDVPNLTGVTNLSFMFFDAIAFNGDIGGWDTQNITNMFFMFRNASTFNRNIGNWNTQNVTNMSGMFYQASAFNQNIGNWNTQSVTNMSSMFYQASAFNQNIGNWNTQNVLGMASMFQQASAFNQNIGNWNTQSVTNMDSMFNQASSFNQDLSAWCVTSISSAPTDFDSGASAWALARPVWGTCPVP